MANAKTAQIIERVREQGMVRPRDLTAHGIPRIYLQRLYERGALERLGRGVYVLAQADLTQNASLAEVCKRIPHGVICLLSALYFHDIGTQIPRETWVAIRYRSHTPTIGYPPLRVVRISGSAFSEGVEEHQTPDGLIRVYGVAKTVADCFRYRNQVGLDVALEALRECRRTRRVTLAELGHYASVDGVSTVMRPYLEAVS
jgi:predicted transcriptional regulator of viral defense system